MRILFVVFLFLLATGCANHPLLELPQTEEEFMLSPTEMENRYPDIVAFHEEHKDENSFPYVDQLIERWGEPNEIRRDDENYWLGKVQLPSMLYIATRGNVNITLGTTALIYLLHKPPGIYVWDKGNYKIEAHTFRQDSSVEKNTMNSWRWYYKGDDQYTDWLAPKEKGRFYFSQGFSTGGEKFAASKNGEVEVGAGDLTTFSLGYSYYMPSDKMYLKTSVGYEYSGFLIPVNGAKITQFPIDLLVAKKLTESKFTAGGGITYLYNARMTGPHRDGFDMDFDLGKTFGLVGILEYRFDDKHGVGMRAEYLSYTPEGENELEANNIGLYFTNYFQ